MPHKVCTYVMHAAAQNASKDTVVTAPAQECGPTLLHSARTFTRAAITSALVSRLRKLKLENFSGKL